MPRTLLLCIFAAFASATPLFAQDERATKLTALAPFINEQTIAVLRVDVRKIDVPGLKKQLVDPVLQTDTDRVEAAAVFEKLDRWMENVRAVDGQIYAVGMLPNMLNTNIRFDPEDLIARSTFVVIPQKLSASALNELNAGLQKMTQSKDPKKTWQCKMLGGATVIAPADLLDYLAEQPPAARPEFDPALAVGAQYPLSLAIVPPPIFARAAEEILIEPVPGWKQSWGSVIGHGMRWIGIGAEPNLDKFKADLIVQSRDADAATKLADAIKQAITTNFLAKPPADNVALNALLTAQLFALIPEAKGDQLVLQLAGERATTLGILAKELYIAGMRTTWQNQKLNTLKYIALSLLNYEDRNKQLPDRAIRDKSGKPLLSWRVAVLSDLDDGMALYKQFHLDEPWDSEHNRKLIDQMPETYRSIGARLDPGKTRYLAVVGEHCAFPLDRGIKFAELSDGTSRTILVVEAAPERAVIWTKPDDLEVNLDDPWQGLGSEFSAAFADGHSQGLSKKFDEKLLRALFTRDGGEEIKW